MSDTINQITASNLTEINSYLEEIESNLLRYHSEKETNDIILIIREQIFQQIELEVTLGQVFNITKIIHKVKIDNNALISGNDRDEVIFTLNRPIWYKSKTSFQEYLKRRKVTEYGADGSSPTLKTLEESRSVEYRTYLNNKKSLELLLPIAILYGILGIIPGELFGIIAAFLFTTFSLVSWFSLSQSSGSTLLIQFFVTLAAAWTMRTTYFIDSYFLAGIYAQLLLPIFVVVTTYKLMKSEIIDSNFNQRGDIGKLAITLIMSGIYYGFLAILISQLLDIYPTLRWDYLFVFALLSFVALYLAFRSNLVEKIDLRMINNFYQNKKFRESKLSNKRKASSTEDDISIQNDISENKTKRVTALKNTDYFQNGLEPLFGGSMPRDMINLTVNQDEASKLIKFRKISSFRVFVLILSVFVFGFAFFFRSLSNVYAINHQIELFGIYEDYYLNYPWQFRYDMVQGLLYTGLALFSLLALLYIAELIKHIRRGNIKKIINHLVLRQGSITVSSLSTVPPRVNPVKYYNMLGELVLKGVIIVAHKEGMK